MLEHVLTGIDGRNPLGLFCAVGLLRVLDDQAARRGRASPTLAFATRGDATPTLASELTLAAIVELVLDDAREQGENRALQFAYTAEGELAIAGASDAIRDLKPPPAIAARFLRACAEESRARVTGLAAAWFSELVTDKTKGNTKPSALHFTAGQQAFLEMVEELRRGITAHDLHEALLGPWRNTSTLPSLSWDASVSRMYALRARDPSEEKRGSVPAANWLGVIALEAFPVVPVGRELATTGVVGGWKDSVFRWPLWLPPLTFRAVRSLLRVDPCRWTSAQRDALGISEVMGARILRSDQGGYGSFAPSHVEVPASSPQTSR